MKTSVYIFMQCLLCLVLAAFCLAVKYRENTATSQVGTFGFSNEANDTFSHLAGRLYSEVCHD